MAAFMNIKFEAKIFITSVKTRQGGLLGGIQFGLLAPAVPCQHLLGVKIKTGATLGPQYFWGKFSEVFKCFWDTLGTFLEVFLLVKLLV